VSATSSIFLAIHQSYNVALQAGEDLDEGEMVCVKDADGKVYKADADAATLRPAIGATETDVSSGGYVNIIISGIRNDGSSLTEGGLIYLSTTAGATTQTGGSGKQAIGYALTTSKWYMQCQLAYNVPTA